MSQIPATLTAAGAFGRRERLWKALPGACDVLVIAAPEHLTYFGGYVPSPFVFRTVESGAMLVLEPGHATLVADSMVKSYADAAFADEVVAPDWYDGRHSAPERRGLLVERVLGRLAKVGGSRIGVEFGAVPSGVVEGLRAARPRVEFVDLSPVIRPLRRSKDADEVAALTLAMRAGEAGQAEALRSFRPGMTEHEAYRIVQASAESALGGEAIVYGDFASGPRTATDKGGPPTDRKIAPGDLFLLDFSVVVSGYRGDFANTFAVGGAPTPDQRRLYDACVAAMAAGEALLRPGTPAHAVDHAVRSYFAGIGLAQAFPHHTGHGIGLGHPEPPYFVPEASETLVEGDVVTIEPGLYVEGTGGMRFEHNYRITAGGFERLSNHEIRIEA